MKLAKVVKNTSNMARQRKEIKRMSVSKSVKKLEAGNGSFLSELIQLVHSVRRTLAAMFLTDSTASATLWLGNMLSFFLFFLFFCKAQRDSEKKFRRDDNKKKLCWAKSYHFPDCCIGMVCCGRDELQCLCNEHSHMQMQACYYKIPNWEW